MKKPEIAKDLARESGVTEAEAADRLDGVVHDILSKLRSGKSASLPGVGRFRPDAAGKVRFERAKGERRRG
jgi:nucleoid DNA-binding protein